MEVQEVSLALRKTTDAQNLFRLDTHALERCTVSHGRDDERAKIVKSDEALIEEVIDGRGEEQAVLAI
jgi:hypothetical protein